MADANSVTTFVMDAELPWPDEMLFADVRGALDRAAIYEAGERHE